MNPTHYESVSVTWAISMLLVKKMQKKKKCSE